MDGIAMTCIHCGRDNCCPMERAIVQPCAANGYAPVSDYPNRIIAEAASLADTAPAHAREFWRRLADTVAEAVDAPAECEA